MKIEIKTHTPIGEIPPALIDPLVSKVGNPASWPDNDRSRCRALANTRSLLFRDDLAGYQYGVDASFDPVDGIRDLEPRREFPEIEPIIDNLLKLGVGKSLGKILIASLAPRKRLGVHTDRGDYFRIYNRIHIPLVTDPEVVAIVGEEKVHMRTGVIYLFANLMPHGFINHSSKPRLHLVVDVGE